MAGPDDFVSRRSAAAGPASCMGAAGVVVLWSTVVVGMRRSGLGLLDDRTISYLGTVPTSDELFRTGLLAATLLLVGFAFRTNKRLTRATGFLPVFLVGMAGQAVVAAVPLAGDGSAHAVHTTAGIILGLSLPVFIWRFAAGQAPGPWRRWCYTLTWVSVAATVAGVALSRAHVATIAEAVPAVAFHIWILVVTVHERQVELAEAPHRE